MEHRKLKILSILIIAILMLSVYPSMSPSGAQNIKFSVKPDIVSNEIKYGYIANGNPYVDYITVFNRQTMKIVDNITVGAAPAGIVTSPNGSFVYVANFDSNNVSVISTGSSRVIKTINVGNSPGSIAISPDGNYVLVANSGSMNVSIINTSTYSVTSVMVGGVPGGNNVIFYPSYPTTVPDGIVFSPNSTFAYVGNAVGNVTVVNVKSGTVIRQIAVSTYHVNGLAISSNGLYLYAVVNEYVPANDYGSHVSVISTQSSSILYNISTDFSPESIVLNNKGTLAYVTSAYNNTVDVLNLSTRALDSRYYLPNSATPMGLSFSPGYQLLYVSDSGNNSVSVINIGTGSISTYQIGIYPVSISMSDLYPVNFDETGLPAYTNWSVIVNSINIASNVSQIQFLEPNGSYSYTLGIVSGYMPNQNHGSFTVSGNSLSITILWTRVTYQISFIESGLPSGTEWAVTFNNTARSSTSNVINFIEPNGTYSFIVGTVPGYRAANNSGHIIVNGKNVTQNIVWSVNKYSISFVESGLRAGVLWSVTLNGTSLSSKSTVISFNEPNGSYSYNIGKINGYVANKYTGTITVNGANVTVPVSWSPILYAIYFNETGLAVGTSWSVTLYGTLKSSTTSSIMFSEPNGSYIFSIESISGYTVSPQSKTIIVNGAIVQENITFTPIPPSTYEITFIESGLPAGTNWSVTFNGATNYSTSNSISFYAKNGTYTYSIGMISGYSVNSSSGNIIVSGAGISKVVSFSQIVAGLYYVIFEESGLPYGANWSVTFNGYTKYSTSSSITFTASNGTYSYSISVPSGYSVQYTTGTINVEGKSLVVPLNVSKSTPFPWLLIILIVIIIVVVIIILFILLKRKRPKQYGQGPGYYGQQAPPGPPPNYPPPQQQYPGPYPGPVYQPQTQTGNQNVQYQVNQQNQNVQPQAPQVQGMQAIGQGEMMLLNLPGASFTTVDGRKISTIPYSGSIVITEKHFIFASKGKKATAITGALAGGIFGGMVSKEMTKVDLSNIQQELTEPGSFILDLSNISSIIAKPSGLSRFSNGKLNITSKVPVSPNGLGITGYAFEFSFMPKGYPGGTDLKKNMADYINTTIAQMVGK
jgi:YVTN family beta-propeller protein